MKKNVKMQWKLLWSQPAFYFSLLLMTILCCGAFFYFCYGYYRADIADVPAANYFFLGSAFDGLPSAILYLLFPLAVVFPFADSYYRERNKNLLPVLLLRSGHKKYYVSKLITVFASGWLVLFLPLLLSFLLNFIAFPVQSFTDISNFPTGDSNFFLNGVKSRLFKELLIDAPYLYLLFYLLIASFVGGIVAVAVYNFSFFVKRQHLLLLCSMFILINVVDLISKMMHSASFALNEYMIAGAGGAGEPKEFMLPIALFFYVVVAFASAPFAMKKLGDIV